MNQVVQHIDNLPVFKINPGYPLAYDTYNFIGDGTDQPGNFINGNFIAALAANENHFISHLNIPGNIGHIGHALIHADRSHHRCVLPIYEHPAFARKEPGIAIGITDGDLDKVVEEGFKTEGSLIIEFESGWDDLVGDEIFSELFHREETIEIENIENFKSKLLQIISNMTSQYQVK